MKTPLRSLTTAVAIGFAAALGLACGANDAIGEGDDEVNASTEPKVDDQGEENPALVIKDPRTLVELEKRGLAFADMIGARGGASGKDFMATKTYRAIADTIDKDLATLRQKDPQSGVGFDFLHRQFDPKWLRSPQARFELVGVVNRLDLKHGPSCGDFRLNYRLAYTAKLSEGRLPMTVSFVFEQRSDGQGCATVAQRWLDAKSGSADALLGDKGPLADRSRMDWIDINVQAVRWPSNGRPKFGGESEYILRTFWVKGENAGPQALLNTPRTDLTPEGKLELKAWIKENLDGIDRGAFVVPEKFLARQAIAVGPVGMARLANRPYSQLFQENDFADLALGATKQIKSPAALLRRLDTMTCQGCHQARSLAGFHMLGEERDPDQRLNALAVGRSPHFLDELPWRAAHLEAVAKKQPFAEPRPFAEHATNDGRSGAHCGLGDAGFASWTCASGLRCLDNHGEIVGVCAPEKTAVGDACVTSKVTLDPDPHADTATGHETLSCDAQGPDARCNPVKLGFPDGLCRVDCAAEDSGKVSGNTICGGIPSASGLTKCLTVERKPFKECLATTMNPTLLRTCGVKDPCRDDYACMRVKDGPANVGACMPPYFAFQARVDGHMFDE